MKNLKMFAIAVMAFAVMATNVHAIDCGAGSVAKSETYCYTSTQLTQSSAAADALYDDNVITLLDDVTLSADMVISKDITIDLGDNNSITFDASHGFVVSGKLTIKGEGEINSNTSATKSLITVSGGGSLSVEGNVKLNYTANTANLTTPAITVNAPASTSNTTVTFASTVNVTSNGYGLAVLGTSAPKVTVNMAGTWDTKGYVAKVNGTVGYASSNAPIINVNEGKYTSEGTALYASGYAIWNIKAGEVKGAQALEAKSGIVNISGGKLMATGATSGSPSVTGSHALTNGNAINVVRGGAHYVDVKRLTINITGGDISSDKGYAMYIKDLRADGKINVDGGSLTSGKDSDGQLAAIKIDDATPADAKAFIEHHADMVTGGEFAGDVFARTQIATNTYATPADLAATLVEGEINTNGGNTTVGDNTDDQQGNTGDNANTPGTTPDDGTTGRLPDQPAKTNDNILVYAGLGLVSALTVSFSAKRKENN